MAEALPLRSLSGFGRVRHSLTHLARPQRRGQLAQLLDGAEGPVLARGFGRAYGDAAQIESGCVIDMTRLDRLLVFDAASGVLVCETGARLAEIDRLFVPRGFCLPVVPGTGWVSGGGGIAADFIVAVVATTLALTFSKDEPNQWLGETWGFTKQIMPLLGAGVLIAGFLLGSQNGNNGNIPNEWIVNLVGG